MSDVPVIDKLRRSGAEAIEAGSVAGGNPIPLATDGVVFRQMFEYAVSDFEAEVGFYAEVFGLDTVALTAGYALFKHPSEGFCLSFRRLPDSPPPATVGLRLLLMTTDLDAAERHLEETELVSERETREGSASQRVIHFESPGGVAVEIWEHAATRS